MELNQDFKLDHWRVQPEEKRIIGPEGEVHLTPRAMAVLVYLAGQAGRVVSREDLNDELWAPAVVTDHALTQCIAELRRALGDSASSPRFIETVPKSGYRLIAAVSSLEESGEQGNQSGTAPPGRWNRVRLSAWAFVALALMITAGLWLFDPQPDPLLPDRSIAVLPFEEIGTDAGLPIGPGLHHDLLTRLSGIEDMRVISNTSVRQYRDTIQPIPEIARQLGVAWILEGSIQQSGDEIQLNAQLIDAHNDTHLWAKTYRRELTAKDLFAIQAEIVDDIADSMQSEMTLEEATRVAATPTESTEAYTYYLRAQEYMRRDWNQQDDLEIAIDLFQRAVEVDPEFALAHADLSSARLRMYWFAHDRSDIHLELAHQALERALAIDPDNPRVTMAEGIYHYWRYRDFERALEAFNRTRELIPNDADVYLFLGAIQRRLGLWDQAIENYERSRELDPRDLARLLGLIRTYMAVRDYPSANRYLDMAEALFPDSETVRERRLWANLKQTGEIRPELRQAAREFPGFFNQVGDRWLLAYLARDFEFIVDNADQLPNGGVDMQRYYYPKSLVMGISFQALGKFEQARDHLDAAVEQLEALRDERPDDPRIRGGLGRAYAALGRAELAVKEGERAMVLLPVAEDARRGPAHELNMARIHAALGNSDEALDYIERLLAIPFDKISPGMLRSDPAWDPLREESRFVAIIQDS